MIAADLEKTRSGIVVVGNETARVCQKAAQEAKKHPDACVCAAAGWSNRFGVFMGNGPMKTYLQMQGVPLKKLVTPVDPLAPFRTNGEMLTFVKTISLYDSPEEERAITVVVRWWHAPRAYLLLKARLRKAPYPYSIRMVLAPSYLHWRMFVEPLALARNVPDYF